jgi:hypothetical protein
MSGLDGEICVAVQLWAAGLPAHSLWPNGDREWAFSAFLEEGPIGFLLMLIGVCIDELHIAGAKNLETVMEIRTRSQRLGTKTGAGVINLKKEQWLGGVIAYGSFDIGRVATSKEKKGKQCEDAE